MRTFVLSSVILFGSFASAHASTFNLMFERTTNSGPGSELAFVAYPSFSDVIAGTNGSTQFSQIDVSGTFDTTGITRDGDDFLLMFERTTNSGPGSELAFVRYPTFSDVLAGTSGFTQFSQIDVSGTFDTTGITRDGDDFLLMFERTTNSGPGSELAFVRYPTFSDVLAGTSGFTQFSQIDVSGNFDTTGLVFVPDDPVPPIPLPGSGWALLGAVAGLSLLRAKARRKT